ncbi:Alpha/beta hydrolase domain protein [Entamoeba marina]
MHLTFLNYINYVSKHIIKTCQVVSLFLAVVSLCFLNISCGLTSLFVFILFFISPSIPSDHATLLTSPNKQAQEIANKIVLKPFRLPWGMCTGIAQSLFVGLKYGIKSEFDRTMITASDGGEFALDWLQSQDNLPTSTPIIIIYHGLAGGSRESYVQRFAYHSSKQKYRVCVFTCRGCAGTTLKTPRAYSSTNLDDSITALKVVHEKYPESSIFTVGYSLGGMILMQVVARLNEEFVEKVHLKGCVAVSPTWGSLLCRSYIPDLFMVNFFGSLRRIAKKNEVLIDSCIENKEIKQFDFGVLKNNCGPKKIITFDQYFNSKIFQYGDSETYYYDVEQWYHLISSSKIPFLTLNAEDDPIAILDQEAFIRIRNTVASSQNMNSVFTRTGGHLGWIHNGKKAFGWDDDIVLQYLKALLESNQKTKK